MSQTCSRSDCFVHDGEGCQEGLLTYKTQCPHWSANTKATETTKPSVETPAGVLWSSSSLGLVDLASLVVRGRAILIGILGAYDAGKTTLLTANYLQLLRGQGLVNAHFAGSRTLEAWESLAAWTRFDDAARLASFPPHTPRGTSRVPGLLHLALRGADDMLRDVLLTDAPGEWFTNWATNEEAADAEGARWIVQHADAFLVLADNERLCGKERGTTRNAIRGLLERLSNDVAGRPTALIWAKADHQPSEGIQDSIRRALYERIPHAVEVKSTTTELQSTTRALEAVLGPAWMPPRARPIVEPIVELSPFAAFRGHRAHS